MIYEIRLKGCAEGTVAKAFDDFELATGGHVTVLRGELSDPAALFGVIERIRRLGIELVALRTLDG